MVKRAGVGIAGGRIEDAARGACAIECPACPQASTMDPALPAFLNTLFVMLDGNFRLKCKNRSLSDPSLGSGLASFVDESEYDTYVAGAGLQREASLTQPVF